MPEYKHALRPFSWSAHSLSQPGACVCFWMSVSVRAQVCIGWRHCVSFHFCFTWAADPRPQEWLLVQLLLWGVPRRAQRSSWSGRQFHKQPSLLLLLLKIHTRALSWSSEELVSQNEYVVYLLFSIPVLFWPSFVRLGLRLRPGF